MKMEIKKGSSSESLGDNRTQLNSAISCHKCLSTHNAAEIASQIRRDQELCRSQKLPSLLAFYLPSAGSKLADTITIELCPDTAKYGRSITRAQYSGIVQGIKAYLNHMTPVSRQEELPKAMIERLRPSKKDFETALDVLDFCLKDGEMAEINPRTSLEDLVHVLKNHALRTQSSKHSATQSPSINEVAARLKDQRKCYICQFILLSHHPQYSSLCRPCGDFNLASCELSLPQNLSLQGKTALITGGRVNLGYHTALRLLRCGARVIVSTRYPRDAEARYLAEGDFHGWSQALSIIGADFRAAKDVFHLIGLVKDQLKNWDAQKLDILMNNAAQTLTDPLETERRAVQKEYQLKLEETSSNLLHDGSEYHARIRGGMKGLQILAMTSQQEVGFLEAAEEDTDLSKNFQIEQNLAHKSDADSKSSWTQSMSQIPYEDVISAHSVNTFVPLILTRELLPLMGRARDQSPSENSPTKPQGYIINVSSREGIFESHPNSSSKNGHHVHTNLTKAALNMLTETEAGPAWRDGKVAINSVDPGYMSAAPEIEKKWKELGRNGTPIGWDDGAGRVLWPIAVGESGEAVWGRFLKHFGSVDVDVGLGR